MPRTAYENRKHSRHTNRFQGEKTSKKKSSSILFSTPPADKFSRLRDPSLVFELPADAKLQELNTVTNEVTPLTKLVTPCVIVVQPGASCIESKDFPLPKGWADIEGAAGCSVPAGKAATLTEELQKRGYDKLYLWNSHSSAQQKVAAVDRKLKPAAMISDEKCALADKYQLPTFVLEGKRYYHRFAVVVGQGGKIEKLFIVPRSAEMVRAVAEKDFTKIKTLSIADAEANVAAMSKYMLDKPAIANDAAASATAPIVISSSASVPATTPTNSM